MPKDQVTISLDLFKRIGRVIDDVVTFEECNCPDGECQGDCLWALADKVQDELIAIEHPPEGAPDA